MLNQASFLMTGKRVHESSSHKYKHLAEELLRNIVAYQQGRLCYSLLRRL